ncbi:MAG TPA: nitrile hydratase accessory protein [Acidimicrobiia bacterium]|nr:nitrile hydratase accessory protein [Acidimicrobiia bacterium]
MLGSVGGSGDDGGPVFAVPWQADAFAMVVALTDAGVFTGAEWSDALGAAIRSARAAGDPDLGDTYYHHWVAALERLCVTRTEIVRAAIDECQNDWRRAYENTPHGQAVERQEPTEQGSGP